MQKSEVDFLRYNKKREGKNEMQIKEEITNLLISQTEFKNIKKTIKKLESLIEKKDKIILELRKKLENKKEKDFKKEFKEIVKKDIMIKNDNRDYTQYYINRVLNHFTKGEWYTKSDMRKILMIPQERVSKITGILLNLNQVQIKKEKGVVKYSLV